MLCRQHMTVTRALWCGSCCGARPPIETVTLWAIFSNSSGSPVTVTVIAATLFENICAGTAKALHHMASSLPVNFDRGSKQSVQRRLNASFDQPLPSSAQNGRLSCSEPAHSVCVCALTASALKHHRLRRLTSTMQQARLKMSAFSLYGRRSITSGAMLRNDPV